jgi:hypothetical protein
MLHHNDANVATYSSSKEATSLFLVWPNTLLVFTLTISTRSSTLNTEFESVQVALRFGMFQQA